MPNLPLHVPAGSRPPYGFGDHVFRFLATGADTGGSYSAMELHSPHQSGPGPHTHDDSEEHFMLVEGQVEFIVEGQVFIVDPGDLVHVPRGAVHQFTVLAPEARMVATYTPAGEEEAFIEAAELLTADAERERRRPLA